MKISTLTLLFTLFVCLNANAETYHPHPNGGGLISEEAKVDEQVFVARGAVVRGHSEIRGEVKLLGHAVVEDVIIDGDFTLDDNTYVKDSQLLVKGFFSGNSRIINARLKASPGGNLSFYESPQIIGESITSPVIMEGEIILSGNILIKDRVQIYGKLNMWGEAVIENDVQIHGSGVTIYNGPHIMDNVVIRGRAKIFGNTILKDRVRVEDDAIVYGSAILEGDVLINEYAVLRGSNTVLQGNAHLCGVAFVNSHLIDFYTYPEDFLFCPKAREAQEYKRVEEQQANIRGINQRLSLTEMAGRVFVPISNPNMSGGLSVLAQSDIEQVFSELQNDELLAISDPQDGCYARSEYFAILMERLGFETLKVFAITPALYANYARVNGVELGKILEYQLGDESVNWLYHVANIVAVRTKDGIKVMVVDLSLGVNNLRLIPVLDWLRLLTPIEHEDFLVDLYFAHRYTTFPMASTVELSEYFTVAPYLDEDPIDEIRKDLEALHSRFTARSTP